MKYLIDTNVLSEAVKSIPNKSVLKMLEKCQHEIVTAAPVWHELQFGCYRLPPSRKREIIASFLNDIVRRTMPILPYDDRAAEWHARERARLSSRGLTPSHVFHKLNKAGKVLSPCGSMLIPENKSQTET